MTSIILDALELWRHWLPNLTFTSVASEEELLFNCVSSGLSMPGRSSETVFVIVSSNNTNYFQHAEIIIAFNASEVSRVDAENIILHETGHVMGLSDTGRLMLSPYTLGQTELNAPTVEELQEIQAAYGVAVPEFPYYLALFLSLFLVLSFVPRRKVKPN